MKVWVVFSEPDGYGAGGYPAGVFATQELADAAAEASTLGWSVEEFDLVDAPAEFDAFLRSNYPYIKPPLLWSLRDTPT